MAVHYVRYRYRTVLVGGSISASPPGCISHSHPVPPAGVCLWYTIWYTGIWYTMVYQWFCKDPLVFQKPLDKNVRKRTKPYKIVTIATDI
jgi:hypothetical protein